MANVDLSRISPPDYPDLIERWKSTAKTPYKRGRISDNGINIVFGADTGSLNIEFYLFQNTQTLEVILHGYDAGHRVTWIMPMNLCPQIRRSRTKDLCDRPKKRSKTDSRGDISDSSWRSGNTLSLCFRHQRIKPKAIATILYLAR